MRRVASLILILPLFVAAHARALTLESIGHFDQPTYVASDPGDANRLFVTEREGHVQLVVNGIAHQFVDLSSKIQCAGACQGERGLMSLAVAPDFDTSGHVFVMYVNNTTGTIHVDQLTAAPGLETASLTTLETVFTVGHGERANHNGGQVQYGPDGMLYASTGDGGGNDDELHHSQDLGGQLGKILRASPEPGATASIWSYGLRNPFRFSFDRETGDLVIGDVGQTAREEVDFAPSPAPGQVGGSGANYGWNCREGFIAGPATDPECAGTSPSDFVNPVFDYPHEGEADAPDGGGRCAIIGGYVVRDHALGELFGRYLYADLCSGAIRALQLPSSGGTRASEDCWTGLRVNSPVSFGEDADNRLYVVTQDGEVSRIAGQPPSNCPPEPPEESPEEEEEEEAEVPDNPGNPGNPGNPSQPSSPSTPDQTSSGGSAPAGDPGAPPQGSEHGGKAVRWHSRPAKLSLTASPAAARRGAKVTISAQLSPCAGRSGEPVELLRGGKPAGSALLGKGCIANFRRRIRHRSTFTATAPASNGFAAARAPRLTIALLPRGK